MVSSVSMTNRLLYKTHLSLLLWYILILAMPIYLQLLSMPVEGDIIVENSARSTRSKTKVAGTFLLQFACVHLH